MRRPGIGLFHRARADSSPSFLSRRHFVGVTAAAAGMTLGSGLWTRARAESDDNEDQQGQGCPDPHAIPHIEVTATTLPVPATNCPANPGMNGFKFVSDPAKTTISHFAQIGRERNGVFFPD